MRVTGFITYIVHPRRLFLKIETDEGLEGWGVPIIEGKAHTVQKAVAELMDFLVGQDPTSGGVAENGCVSTLELAATVQVKWGRRLWRRSWQDLPRSK